MVYWKETVGTAEAQIPFQFNPKLWNGSFLPCATLRVVVNLWGFQELTYVWYLSVNYRASNLCDWSLQLIFSADTLTGLGNVRTSCHILPAKNLKVVREHILNIHIALRYYLWQIRYLNEICIIKITYDLSLRRVKLGLTFSFSTNLYQMRAASQKGCQPLL